MITNRTEVVKKARETHRENIRRSLQHRLEVARAKGDENLIRQLEAEMRYFG
ncbi:MULTISPECIES: arginine synthesis PII-interacting regulator PirA [Fischerella]|uniref:arginine synthesis PII-interacting regulator PirA n=1 Tax=Fischerella TaxID=1190 RepID=UPI00071FCF67|nr:MULTISPECIES: hypothetical protein [Fischerella]BAU07330.1 hypothetical protein FIS3754_32580 [Fischerella sp. NIES-3754]BCX09656.1 MAG: hypothetical protein KatS3mg066_3515 [Fischerella sp.]